MKKREPGVRLGLRWLLWPVILTGFLFLWTVPADAGTPYEENGALSVRDGQVVNAQGEPFVIQGVSTHGLAWYPEYVNLEAFRTLRDRWKVNTIRLAVYTAESGGYCTGGNREETKKLIKRGVNFATRLGMYVIIDWHILSDGNPLTYRKEAAAFFRETARRYKNNPNVLYEICNEPNGPGGTWRNVKSYAETVIPAIRKVNPKALIIVGTPTWSQDVDAALRDPIRAGGSIAYAFHFYAATHQAELRQKLEGVLKEKLPVIVTEFALSEASGNGRIDTASGEAWMNLLDRYKVGRVGWNLSNKDESSALLKPAASRTADWSSEDLTEWGRWLFKTFSGKEPDTANPRPSAKVKIRAEAEQVNTWKSGDSTFTQFRVILKNRGTSTGEGWKVTLTLGKKYKLTSSWSGVYKTGIRKLVITPETWNREIPAGGSVELGFIMESSKVQRVKKVQVTY